MRKTKNSAKSSQESSSFTNELYRLKIIDSDENSGRVKVRYIGYGEDYDEWRLLEDIIELGNDSSSGDEGAEVVATEVATRVGKFCLYEELAYRIKSLLYSTRTGNPVCRIIMGFDVVYFEGLIRRATQVNTGKKRVYQLSGLTKLDDLLGKRWYIRGINAAGDFCYIQPDSVKYYLKQCRRRTEFQMQPDGSLRKCVHGGRCQLVFQFVRNDGVLSQWNSALNSCN